MILFGLAVVVILSILNAAPLTFFAMLFAGNLGLSYGFLDLLPGAFALQALKNSAFTYNPKKD